MSRPIFKDYRTTSDGIMVADIGFKKQLHALDPELDVVWNKRLQLWEIWRFPGQKKLVKKVDEKAFHMMSVQTKDRTFRELGADIILKLQQGDPTRYSLEELVAYFDKMDDNIQRAKERDFMNYVSSVTIDNFDYMRGVLKVQVPKRFEDVAIKIDVPKSYKVRRAIGG